MNLLQRNDNWQSERIGKITASSIKDLNAKPKAGQALNSTMLKVLTERLTGLSQDDDISNKPCVKWGIEQEPFAITAYENRTGSFVVQTGLINHPNIKLSGASPDGLVGDDGQIEVKCPSTTTHLNTVLTGEIPREYIPQITWQLAVTGREWCDFISFDPRIDSELSLFIKRVYAKDLDIQVLENEVIKANELLDKLIQQLNGEKKCVA